MCTLTQALTHARVLMPGMNDLEAPTAIGDSVPPTRTSGAESGPVRRRYWLLRGAILSGLTLAVVYRTQPDALAAVTVIPAWCWLLPGAAVLTAMWRLRRSPAWVGLLATGLVYFGLCVEQSRSLVRGALQIDRTSTVDRTWRIVSLNCHVGTAAVTQDLVPLSPDLVLLQESPLQPVLIELSQTLFGPSGAAVSTGDCSIIARGRLELVPTARDSRFIQARWEPVDRPPVMVFSLRLTPPSTRLDWWRPACWQAHRERRRLHRAQLTELSDAIAAVPDGMPVIVGGDFNSPAGDAAHQVLESHVRDSFGEVGCGWGCTFARDFPFHRIDQVWLSRDLRPLQGGAVRAEHSDHRAAVCDVVAL